MAEYDGLALAPVLVEDLKLETSGERKILGKSASLRAHSFSLATVCEILGFDPGQLRRAVGVPVLPRIPAMHARLFAMIEELEAAQVVRG